MILCGLLAGCAAAPDAEDRLLAAVHTKSVTLSEVFDDVAWESLYVVCPYQSRETTAAALGVDSASVPDLSDDDSRQVVLLLDGGEVVRQLPLARTALDLCALSSVTPPIIAGETDTVMFSEAEGIWRAERVAPDPS